MYKVLQYGGRKEKKIKNYIHIYKKEKKLL